MPPRQPGGKYKGLIKRTQAEDAVLAKEAKERAALRLKVQRAKEHNQRMQDLIAAHGATTKAAEREEERRRKIMNLIVGGGRTNTQKKFFKGWCAGVGAVREAKRQASRAAAWKATCSHGPWCPGGCSAFTQLRDVVFAMPSELGKRPGSTLSTVSGSPHRSGSSPALISNVPRSGSSPALIERTSGRGDAAVAGWSIPGQGDSTAGRKAITLPMIGGAGGEPEPWIGSKVEIVSHFQTGRRCFLDRHSMRMCFADERPSDGFRQRDRAAVLHDAASDSESVI